MIGFYPASEVLGEPTSGILLLAARVREGLTQKQLADAVGLKQSHILEMERDKRKISPKIAKRLAKFLKTSE